MLTTIIIIVLIGFSSIVFYELFKSDSERNKNTQRQYELYDKFYELHKKKSIRSLENILEKLEVEYNDLLAKGREKYKKIYKENPLDYETNMSNGITCTDKAIDFYIEINEVLYFEVDAIKDLIANKNERHNKKK